MEPKDKVKGLLRKVAAEVVHHSGLTGVLQKQDETPWRILMYHRVIDPRQSAYPLQPGMYVTPETFAMQMKFLAEEAQVIALDELTDALTNKEEVRL